MKTEGTLKYIVDKLLELFSKKDVKEEHLWYVIRGAVNPKLLISNLAEALRITENKTKEILKNNGFGDVVAQAISASSEKKSDKNKIDYFIPTSNKYPFEDIFTVTFSPSLDRPVALPQSLYETTNLLLDSLLKSIKSDPFTDLYRNNVLDYYNEFMNGDARLIDEYIKKSFNNKYPKYIVNSGIGANEQFNHFVATLNNNNSNRKVTWLIISSTRHLNSKLPEDTTFDNTLFMEFSRSGKTEETVKIHEYTNRKKTKRIVFANEGPLNEIGHKDNNLVLNLPDRVSGRFGRNKTPILLAPMFVAKMDVESLWRKIDEATSKFDLSSPSSLPMQIALFIFLFQKLNNINHIYLGYNDDILHHSANEMLQFWNEGVNKNANDIMMSNYFGLLRDSHANIEGILSNHKTKMGIFLLRSSMTPNKLHPMISRNIDPINSDHSGLKFGDEEKILAEANYQRFSELMPSIKINVHGDLSLVHAAVFGQLWSDITFCYSLLVNVDPGSNPEVKFVRDRSEKLLAKKAR